MKDLKISSLLTLTTALMLSATCVVASDSEDGEAPLASSYQHRSGLLRSSAAPAVDKDDMGAPQESNVFGSKKESVEDLSAGAAATGTTKTFTPSGNPDLYVGELTRFFADLEGIDTVVFNALGAFTQVASELYSATGTSDPSCKAGMARNVEQLYTYLKSESDVAAALAHVHSLVEKHQGLLDASRTAKSQDSGTVSPVTHQPGATFPAAATAAANGSDADKEETALGGLFD